MQDHVKGSCDFMEGISSLYIITLLSLVAIGIVVEKITYLTYHMTLQGHVMKVLTLWKEAPHCM